MVGLMLTGWMILMLAGEADTVIGVAVNTCWAERGVRLCGELLAGVTDKVAARLAARDLRSSVGSNLALLWEESGSLDPCTSPPGRLKAAL